MCGITGIFSSQETLSHFKLEKMTSSLAHRGPDGSGLWFSKNKKVGLGHRLLKIMDDSSGSQPITSFDENIVISVNGEFYDFESIKKNLIGKGYTFQTHSDSEILLCLYQEYGIDFIKKLRGEFSFILYDQNKNRLIAGRDRFGIKPLCYHLDPHGTLFIASEAKSMLSIGIGNHWDEKAFSHSLFLQYLPQDKTFFKDIHLVKPGHFILYDGEKLTQNKYWDIDFPTTKSPSPITNLTEESLTSDLENLLIESIQTRLQGNKDICFHLSGGLDSSLIAAMASKISGKASTCFSISFENKDYDESNFAQKTVEHIGGKLIQTSVNTKKVIENLEKAVYFTEGTTINNHLVAKFLLNKKIKESGFKIAFTGEGADEGMGGYSHLRQDHFGENITSHENDLITDIQFSKQFIPAFENIKDEWGFVPSFLQAKGFMGTQINEFINPSLKNKLPFQELSQELLSSLDSSQLKSRSKVDKSTYLWMKFTLANYILKTLGDGCEMAHGIEGRVPFLDHKLFEYMKNIPIDFKITPSTEKYLLRKVAEKYLPPEIYNRPKKTFMAPPLLLDNREGIEFINDHLRSNDFRNFKFFDSKSIISWLDTLQHLSVSEKASQEPLIMVILTSFFIQKNFKLST